MQLPNDFLPFHDFLADSECTFARVDTIQSAFTGSTTALSWMMHG
jgi:hypothetical protein